jgi:hypothetical protein
MLYIKTILIAFGLFISGFGAAIALELAATEKEHEEYFTNVNV